MNISPYSNISRVNNKKQSFGSHYKLEIPGSSQELNKVLAELNDMVINSNFVDAFKVNDISRTYNMGTTTGLLEMQTPPEGTNTVMHLPFLGIKRGLTNLYIFTGKCIEDTKDKNKYTFTKASSNIVKDVIQTAHEFNAEAPLSFIKDICCKHLAPFFPEKDTHKTFSINPFKPLDQQIQIGLTDIGKDLLLTSSSNQSVIKNRQIGHLRLVSDNTK
jgi:hypothetical protein